ncbi:FtsX-like permease family protein [Marinobacter nauticus]|jgi:ABC-type lipoprotein release transport system permease subunit|uniref:FtsX-like permease family protein n=1 Tax=Marinobacter nauticus TaxID=2743 RepID=UPI001C99C61C|nr:FtsX-like permease family protein [Marinobacter nauticus]MBY5937257.1 ABC transporter permease [Marinobacter nauticus]MBY5954500.1 ABC transporter permease [Marinobacter nauticus]MBY6008278.1 ABC transporter permease [Marinobacter nauticus]
MMAWLRLALGNLRANRRRTGITLLSLTVGVAGLVFLWAFIDGINAQMINNMTGYVTGDLKIHARGFHDDREMNIALPEQWNLPPGVADTEGVAAAAPRLSGHALVSLSDISRAMQVSGVEPAGEKKVTRLDHSLVAGRYLQTGNEILLGAGAALALDAAVGDELALVVQAADGSIGADRFTVVGLFETGVKRIDGLVAQIPLEAAQELYALRGRVTEVAARVDDPDQLPMVIDRLQEQLQARQIEVLGWPELMPSLVQMMDFHNAVAYIVIFVVFVVVAAGIANTILMSVMERGREFGVMMAVGTSGSRIVQLVLLETSLMALAGYALGLALGLAVTAYFASSGLDFTAYIKAMDTMPGLSGIVYPTTSPDRWAIIGLVVIVVALLAAVVPAWIASRHTPLEAMDAHRSPTNRLRRIHSEVTSDRTVLIFAQMALRSLFRNPRRSLITASATTFGLAAYLFLYGFADGFFEQMVRNSTQQLSGHVQLMAKGHDADLSPQLRIDNVSERLRALADEPGVQAAAPRILLKGMVANPKTSQPVELVGVAPEQERQVTELARYMVEGRYVQDDGKGIVIGRKLADELDARLNDKLVVTVQQASGDLASGAYPIRGIYRTGSDLFDSEYVFVNIAQARQLAGFAPNQASRIALRLQDRTQSSPLAESLNRELADTQLVAQDWETLLPVVVQMIEMTQIDFYLILSVVFVVVAIGVMNTMVMSVMERTRELGVMLALGTRGSQLVLTILFEALFLALLGMVAGTVLGGLLVAWLNRSGIDLSAIAGSFETIPGITDKVYPVLIIDHVWLPSLLLFACSVMVALYPARRAARFDPVEAIRHG